ncbi:hypothetical protein NIES4103_22580 [Nostoc sp. NIES-4103]|nr:hypothetical protein NIES4103_22580 [Nostoc sp. NIES-4103]
MHKRLSEISNLLIAPFKAVLSSENLEKAAELSKAFVELAKTLQEQGKDISFLKPLIEQSGSLLGVLCSPEVQVISAGLPFVPFAIALLKYYREKHQTEPTLEVCVAMIAQAAYLENCQEIVSSYPAIIWNNYDITHITQAVNKLNDFELDYQAASNAIACFHKSELAKAFNTVLSARLKVQNTPSADIDILTQRIAWDTHRYILKACIESSDALPQLKPTFGEWQQEAERIKQSLEKWTEPSQEAKTFNVDDQKLHWEIYDLLGNGGLTPEIVKYFMNLLVNSDQFRPVELFKRLENFYVCWCDGEFIDAPPENFPQKKMRLLQEKGIKQGQRQIDIYAGLNVMILLLELHRYGQKQNNEIKKQMTFYPSGKLQKNSRTDLLLRIMNYNDCVQLETFNTVVRLFLSGANLSGANLSGVYLKDADLSGVKLTLKFS